ncbi:MAG: M20/M25/M40 family metallo-hydrolase [Pseudomonadota bacterium]|nr:M20/M25/M40 family metallo-hydrolase [Pseudomonadota bacterium]
MTDAAIVAGPEAALAHAQRNRDRSIEALAEIVRIPSLTGEEGAAQARVAELLGAMGAKVESREPDVALIFERFPNVAQYPTHWQHDLILPYEELPTYAALRESGLEDVLNYRGRPNVVGRFAGTGGGRSLILNGHIDCVTIEPAGEWRHAPFGAEIEGGLMFGRGTSDMKGGLVAALMAVAYLREAGVRLKGDVIVQSVVNEEHAGNGTLDLVARGITADAAIVLEPTENRISVDHPGGLYWQVGVKGVARSPGARWRGATQEGVSAIEKLPAVIDALLALERDYNREIGTPGDGVAPFALVMGKIAGGTYETVTANRAVIRGGAYFMPDVGSVLDVMRAFRERLARVNAADSFLAQNPAVLEFLHHDDSTRQRGDVLHARCMAGLLHTHGCDSGVQPGPFACDMRHLVNQGGIPAMIFGPGTIAQAHKPDEHIPIGEYLDCIGHLIRFIHAWCGAEPGKG